MASITQQGRNPMTSPSVISPTHSRVSFSFAALNLRMGILRLIALGNGCLLLSLLVMLIDPTAPLGLLAPLFADLSAALPATNPDDLRFAMIGLFSFILFADVSQSLRRLPPSYGSLFALSGQASLALVTFVYVVMGRLPLLALYGIGGSLALSVVVIIAVVQSYHGATRYRVRALLYPVLSALMGGLGIGLILSPGTATRAIIETRYGTFLLIVFLGALAWGCGQLRLNHLSPKEMVTRLAGLIAFPTFSIRLLESGQPVSMLGVFLTINVSLLSIFCAFAQAEIERIDMQRESTPPPVHVERQG